MKHVAAILAVTLIGAVLLVDALDTWTTCRQSFSLAFCLETYLP